MRIIFKLVAVLVLTTSTFSFVHCQDFDGETKAHSPFGLHVTGDYINLSRFNDRFSVGLMGEMKSFKKMSFLFPMSFGDNYAHFGLGTIFAPLGLLGIKNNTDQSLANFFGSLLFLVTSFESMGYHFVLDEKKEIIPYYSLFRIRAIWDGPNTLGSGLYASWSLGTMIRYNINYRWKISGYAEYTQLYYPGFPRGVQSGITASYTFWPE